MSAHDDSHGSVRFEPTDVATRPVVLSVVALAAFTVVFTIIAWFVFQALAERERAASPVASPLASRAPTQPPEPRLQADPKGDLVRLRARENAELARFGWIDEQAGVVQVPIERAMEMLAAKGLPARPGDVPPKMRSVPKPFVPAPAAEGARGH